MRKNGDGTTGGKPFNGIKNGPHPEEVAKRPSRRTHAGRTNYSGSRGLMGAQLYILRCSDGSYYVGTTRGEMETRLSQHNSGHYDGYTSTRRPVTLVFQQEFERITDAITTERQVKLWRREKKEALIRGDYAALPGLAKRYKNVRGSTQE